MDQLPAEFAEQGRSRTTSWRPTWPRRASWRCATRAPTCRCRSSTWRPRHRRLHARQGGAAPRHRAGRWTSSARSAWCDRGQAVPSNSQGRDAPAPDRLRPVVQERDERLQHRPRQGAAGHARLPVDKDGDGWREQPDGQPLVLEYATSPDATNRALVEQWQKNMKAIGIRMELQDRQVAREPEGQPRRQAADVGRGLERRCARRRHLPGAGLRPEHRRPANHSRFNLPAFNALYEKQRPPARRPRTPAAMNEASSA